MPELPDIALYIECLKPLLLDRQVERIRLFTPFILRSVSPPIEEAQGRTVRWIHRMGKRIVFRLDEDFFLIFHLMIAGRFRWLARAAKPPGRLGLAAVDFSHGTLVLTEAGSKRRASLHLARGHDALEQHDPGGLEVLDADLASFSSVLTKENHTLKRALTDPRLFSGIGNAYSDEILHCARLSPVRLTGRMSAEEIERLFLAVRRTLSEWTERLVLENAGGFPKKVTAFRDGMAVHGRYGKPCPDCGTPVQRIVYAENEANYCPNCQTEGRLLADRALSRLLRGDWPRTLEEMETRKRTSVSEDVRNS